LAMMLRAGEPSRRRTTFFDVSLFRVLDSPANRRVLRSQRVRATEEGNRLTRAPAVHERLPSSQARVQLLEGRPYSLAKLDRAALSRLHGERAIRELERARIVVAQERRVGFLEKIEERAARRALGGRDDALGKRGLGGLRLAVAIRSCHRRPP